jgi:hypothetical protein
VRCRPGASKTVQLRARRPRTACEAVRISAPQSEGLRSLRKRGQRTVKRSVVWNGVVWTPQEGRPQLVCPHFFAAESDLIDGRPFGNAFCAVLIAPLRLSVDFPAVVVLAFGRSVSLASEARLVARRNAGRPARWRERLVGRNVTRAPHNVEGATWTGVRQGRCMAAPPLPGCVYRGTLVSR